ncbi:5,6-dimethylbenzimidazole synthase [compost metagenome]
MSLFEPQALGALLGLPPGAKAVAVLCLGPVPEFYAAPMLQQEGWATPRPLSDLLFDNRWGETR